MLKVLCSQLKNLPWSYCSPLSVHNLQVYAGVTAHSIVVYGRVLLLTAQLIEAGVFYKAMGYFPIQKV